MRDLDSLFCGSAQAWQVLPLVPPERGFWSPYSGLDAMCGNVLLIGLDELAEEGLIDRADLPEPVPVSTADFEKAGHITSSIVEWRHYSLSRALAYHEVALALPPQLILNKRAGTLGSIKKN